LTEAIESVNKYANVKVEVIVVDNASSDHTVEELGARFPQVKFIANKNNVGFSAANNQGVSHSNGERLLFLNPDAKLLDNQLEAALALLEKDTRLLIGPRIVNPDNSLQESVIAIPGAWDIIKEALFLSYFFQKNMSDALRRNNYALSGACILMSRHVFEKLGGFDENLFWMDDVDLCYRARQLGSAVVYYDKWSVMHTIGVSSKKNYSKVIANQLLSKLKFFKKNKRYSDFVISVIFIQVHILLRIILFLVLSPFNQKSRKKLGGYLFSQSTFLRYLLTGSNRVF
jgi:N-acetylglucosaminyl-diphospho-decaprenol L-rhamnosyltransferase